MAEKTRYTDEELEEFRQIINEKMSLAKRDYEQMMRVLTNEDSNDVEDTSPTYKALEEGSATQSKEELISMAARQQKFIRDLRAALIRIENGTYGLWFSSFNSTLLPSSRVLKVGAVSAASFSLPATACCSISRSFSALAIFSRIKSLNS